MTLAESAVPRILVVDDEAPARARLRDLLDECRASFPLAVVDEAKNGREALDVLNREKVDVVLLDIRMPDMDGMEAARHMAGMAEPPAIIFTTAFDAYALKAFEVNAIDYLLKPFDKKRVAQAVAKARKNLAETAPASDQIETLVKMLEQQQAPQPNKLLLRTAGRMFLVDQKEVCFASIEDGVITVVTSQMEGQSNCRTLEELLDSLDSKTFWRAHRSYLVNINRIKEVVPWFKSSYQLRMDDKKQTEVPVSRAQTKRLRELFGL